MKIVDFSKENSVIAQYLAELRDITVQNDRMRYRRNVERIGELIAYEISKTMTYTKRSITTPLSDIEICTPAEEPLIITILRAGLPFHQGFLNIYDKADNGFISAYREYSSDTEFDIKVEYVASPAIDNRVVIINDPMLATGNSLYACYKSLEATGKPTKLHIASVIASEQAIEYVKTLFPDVDTTVWCGAIDPSLNAHGYIVPGLGDAGDLSYGVKL